MYSLSAWKLRHIPYTDHKISVHDPTHENRYRLRSVPPDPPEIIFKRHHTPTCSADQMMMTVFGVSVKYMTDLIPDTSIIEMNPVDQLNLIQKLQRTVHGRKPHSGYSSFISSKISSAARCCPLCSARVCKIESLCLVTFQPFSLSFSLSIPCTFPVLLSSSTSPAVK